MKTEGLVIMNREERFAGWVGGVGGGTGQMRTGILFHERGQPDGKDTSDDGRRGRKEYGKSVRKTIGSGKEHRSGQYLKW